MKTLKGIVRGTGKLTLALLACLLMPVLIWVGLGAAIYQRNRADDLISGAHFIHLTPGNFKGT